jgi:hypothetical protein
MGGGILGQVLSSHHIINSAPPLWNASVAGRGKHHSPRCYDGPECHLEPPPGSENRITIQRLRRALNFGPLKIASEGETATSVSSSQTVGKNKVETTFISIPLQKLRVVDLSFVVSDRWMLWRGHVLTCIAKSMGHSVITAKLGGQLPLVHMVWHLDSLLPRLNPLPTPCGVSESAFIFIVLT